jgi:hypothetical protein
MPTPDPRSTWQRIRDRLLVILSTEVEGVANPYGEPQIIEGEADVQRLFLETPPGRLHTYQLSCRRVSADGGMSDNVDRVEVVIRGYLAARFANTHDEHLSRSFAIRRALRRHAQGGFDSSVSYAEKPSLESFDLVDYCGVACWRSEIAWPLVVIETETLEV